MAVSFADNLETDIYSDLYCNEKQTYTPPINNCIADRRNTSTPFIKIEETATADNGESVRAANDIMMYDLKLVKNMLLMEKSVPLAASKQYLSSSNVTQNMRKILLSWMYEVVTEQKIEEVVFLQAADILDRFLTHNSIEKSKLQLLGCCSLLLASKVRNFQTISASCLSYLTEYAYTEKEIVDYETYVLAKLEWDVNSVLSIDFMQPIISQTNLEHVDHVKRNAVAFMAVLTLYGYSLEHPPSMIATSAVYAGLTFVECPKDEENRLLAYVNTVLGVGKHSLKSMKEIIIQSMDSELNQQRNNEVVEDMDASDSGISEESSTDDDTEEEEDLIESFETLNNLNPVEETAYDDGIEEGCFGSRHNYQNYIESKARFANVNISDDSIFGDFQNKPYDSLFDDLRSNSPTTEESSSSGSDLDNSLDDLKPSDIMDICLDE